MLKKVSTSVFSFSNVVKVLGMDLSSTVKDSSWKNQGRFNWADINNITWENWNVKDGLSLTVQPFKYWTDYKDAWTTYTSETWSEMKR